LTAGCGAAAPTKKTDTTNDTTVAGDTATASTADPASSEANATNSSTPSTNEAGATDSAAPANTSSTPASAPVAKAPSKFDPKTPREKIAAFLRKPAEEAMKAREWGRAIPIYRGLVAALGEGDDAAFELATAWMAAGQQDEALDVLKEFIAETTDAKKRKEAETQLKRLQRRRIRFAKEDFRLESSPKLAKEAFDDGRKAFRKKDYADALIYYKIGYALSPDAAGFLREIGATYEKLGAKDERTKWYVSYLRRRPFGKNADEIRKTLRKDKGALGTVTIKSPFPCDSFVVVGMSGPKLPIKSMAMAPGKYTSLCVNEQFRIGYWEDFDVEAGKTAEIQLAWAVIVNDLKEPYGRIVLENPREAGVMMDLGVSTPEIGVAVPRDRRALKMILKADDGSRVEERFIRLEPGAKQPVKW